MEYRQSRDLSTISSKQQIVVRFRKGRYRVVEGTMLESISILTLSVFQLHRESHSRWIQQRKKGKGGYAKPKDWKSDSDGIHKGNPMASVFVRFVLNYRGGDALQYR